MLLVSFVGGTKDRALAFIDFDTKVVRFWDNPTKSNGIAGISKIPSGYAMAGEIDQNHAIIILLDEQFNLEYVYGSEYVKLPHDVTWYEDRIFVASAGNNSIVCFEYRNRRLTEEYREYFHSPEEYDVYHLNSVEVDGQSNIYFSVFGKRDVPHQWGAMRDGKIFQLCDKDGELLELTDRETYPEGIYHPHSLTLIDDELFYCESHNFMFKSLNNVNFGYTLDGYARGIAHDEENYYVGVSASRNISKSSGEPNETIISSVNCGIWKIAKDGSDMIKLDLSPYGVKEIYDILVIPVSREEE